MDERNPAPPKKPWNDDSPVNTKKTMTTCGFKVVRSGFRPSTVRVPSKRHTRAHNIHIETCCFRLLQAVRPKDSWLVDMGPVPDLFFLFDLRPRQPPSCQKKDMQTAYWANPWKPRAPATWLDQHDEVHSVRSAAAMLHLDTCLNDEWGAAQYGYVDQPQIQVFSKTPPISCNYLPRSIQWDGWTGAGMHQKIFRPPFGPLMRAKDITGS